MKEKSRVRIYTRPGCHLCEEAKAEMRRAGCAELYTLEEINIEGDEELTRRYGWDIPVVRIGDAVAFKHRLTADEFARMLLKAR